jgi:hypothetical protein
MTLSSFEAELYRSASLSKVISWDTLYLVFKDRFLLQPKPNLDAQASFQLPSGDVLSSQGNGDFTVSRRPCQASLATFSVATAARAFEGRRRITQTRFSKAKRLDASFVTQLPTLLR